MTRRASQNLINGASSADTHKKNRQRYRKKLERRGLPPELIDELVERKRVKQAEAREAVRARDARLAAEMGQLDADDSKHRPAKVDSTLTGVARATGATAKSIQRRKAITKYEHDQMSGR